MTLQVADVDLSSDDTTYNWRFVGEPNCPACDEPIRAYGPVRHRSASVWQERNGTTRLRCDCGWTCEVTQ